MMEPTRHVGHHKACVTAWVPAVSTHPTNTTHALRNPGRV